MYFLNTYITSFISEYPYGHIKKPKPKVFNCNHDKLYFLFCVHVFIFAMIVQKTANIGYIHDCMHPKVTRLLVLELYSSKRNVIYGAHNKIKYQINKISKTVIVLHFCEEYNY